MNGTVTVDTIVTGIQADSFTEAIQKVKELPGMVHAKDIRESINEFSCNFDNPGSILQSHAILEFEPLKIV